jgi:hypothetical protein
MKASVKNNGGFPPLVFKQNNVNGKNKERFINPSIKNNINIQQILQTKKTINILNIKKDNYDELEVVTDL